MSANDDASGGAPDADYGHDWEPAWAKQQEPAPEDELELALSCEAELARASEAEPVWEYEGQRPMRNCEEQLASEYEAQPVREYGGGLAKKNEEERALENGQEQVRVKEKVRASEEGAGSAQEL